jgi:hypothetical protein
VIGVDQVLAPLITDAAKLLAALPATDPQHITAQELYGFNFKVGAGSGWPYHHHHIHVSLNWWTSSQTVPDFGELSPNPSLFRDPALPAASLPPSSQISAWPPRGAPAARPRGLR